MEESRPSISLFCSLQKRCVGEEGAQVNIDEKTDEKKNNVRESLTGKKKVYNTAV